MTPNKGLDSMDPGRLVGSKKMAVAFGSKRCCVLAVLVLRATACVASPHGGDSDERRDPCPSDHVDLGIPGEEDTGRGTLGSAVYAVDRVEEGVVVFEHADAGGIDFFFVPLSSFLFPVAEGGWVGLSVFPGPDGSSFSESTPHTFGEVLRWDASWVYCFFGAGEGRLPRTLFPVSLRERAVFALFGRAVPGAGARRKAMARLRAGLMARPASDPGGHIEVSVAGRG